LSSLVGLGLAVADAYYDARVLTRLELCVLSFSDHFSNTTVSSTWSSLIVIHCLSRRIDSVYCMSCLANPSWSWSLGLRATI